MDIGRRGSRDSAAWIERNRIRAARTADRDDRENIVGKYVSITGLAEPSLLTLLYFVEVGMLDLWL